jgi:uncharacterized membrane protein YhaH (DUF805 family)
MDTGSIDPYAAPAVEALSLPPEDGEQNRGIAWMMFSFKGRLTRLKFWLGMTAAWAGYLAVLVVIVFALDAGNVDEGMVSEDSLAVLAFYGGLAPFAWSMVALAVKRWHDRGKSGWYVLVYFVPLIGPLWVLIEPGFLRGTFGPNRFGPDPL